MESGILDVFGVGGVLGVAIVAGSVGLLAGLLATALRRRRPGALARFAAELEARLEGLARAQERSERALREELAKGREEASGGSRHLREEIAASVKSLGDTLTKSGSEAATGQQARLDSFAKQLVLLGESNDKRLNELRGVVDIRLQQIYEESGKKLDQMRQTVDEKLQGTLEKRLGESFKQVSERLEAVHKGLGEMQTLAAGVGDLKKVLSNVKTRGTWGEIQLGNLLDQVLSSEQYEKNVAVKRGSAERVEFALKLPGRSGDDTGGEDVVWLPIDAKFPQEDYLRLVDAQERGDALAADEAIRQLDARIRGSARDIRDKYLNPPATTDFAIMFLPTEGLYAEVLRRPGLGERLQREHRVVVAGPTTLAALLNSLQMGFRTLAIQKRSSEVWKLLGAVKTQFGQFNELLDKVHTKLSQASSTLEDAAKRGRTIERRLKKVEELPSGEARELLPEPESSSTPD